MQIKELERERHPRGMAGGWEARGASAERSLSLHVPEQVLRNLRLFLQQSIGLTFRKFWIM